jgi:hypothetical protein
LDQHPAKTADPEPKDSAWAPNLNGGADPNHIPNPDTPPDGGEKDLERMDAPLIGRFSRQDAKKGAHDSTKPADLKKTGAKRKIESDAHDQKKAMWPQM